MITLNMYIMFLMTLIMCDYDNYLFGYYVTLLFCSFILICSITANLLFMIFNYDFFGYIWCNFLSLVLLSSRTKMSYAGKKKTQLASVQSDSSVFVDFQKVDSRAGQTEAILFC
jgi:hypothetical protein